MNILGIETSGRLCRVGIVSDTLPAAEWYKSVGNAFSETLFSLVRDVLVKAGITIKEVDGVAVCIGPGSFTGIRVGLSAAKGIAHSLPAALIGISAFEVLVHTTKKFPICCVVPIKADKNAYMVLHSADEFLRPTAFKTGNWNEVIQEANQAGKICGDFNPEILDILQKRLADTTDKYPISISAVAVAEIGMRKLKHGAVDSIVNLVPEYALTVEFCEKPSLLQTK